MQCLYPCDPTSPWGITDEFEKECDGVSYRLKGGCHKGDVSVMYNASGRGGRLRVASLLMMFSAESLLVLQVMRSGRTAISPIHPCYMLVYRGAPH